MKNQLKNQNVEQENLEFVEYLAFFCGTAILVTAIKFVFYGFSFFID